MGCFVGGAGIGLDGDGGISRGRLGGVFGGDEEYSLELAAVDSEIDRLMETWPLSECEELRISSAASKL